MSSSCWDMFNCQRSVTRRSIFFPFLFLPLHSRPPALLHHSGCYLVVKVNVRVALHLSPVISSGFLSLLKNYARIPTTMILENYDCGQAKTKMSIFTLWKGKGGLGGWKYFLSYLSVFFGILIYIFLVLKVLSKPTLLAIY